MNIAKAIEIKQKYQYILQDASLPELIEADNISIEALKDYQKLKLTTFLPIGYKLLGETK